MSTNLNHLLAAVSQYARAGQLSQARQLLGQIIPLAPADERVWLLQASLSPTLEERRAALLRVLALNPNHVKARQAYLQAVEARYIRQAAQAGVFVSYARQDEVTAVGLADDLRFFGFPVWLDLLDMPDNSDWHEAVDAAIQRCGLMLLVVSPAAARADNVRSELRRFAEAGKIILPALMQPADLTALNVWYPPLDFSEDYSSGLQDLVYLLAAPEPIPTGRQTRAV